MRLKYFTFNNFAVSDIKVGKILGLKKDIVFFKGRPNCNFNLKKLKHCYDKKVSTNKMNGK